MGGNVMKKGLKIISVVLVLVIFATVFSSCSSKKDIIGQWYNSDGEVEIDVRKDGTYDDGGYGTGTWKYLDDDETIEFTDFYGYTKTTTIEKDDLGLSIFNGSYYKDAYPSDEEISEFKDENAVSLDAFSGIKYEISGISPYCQISINNQGCSENVQKYVTYSLDKSYYANGETAVITATLSEYTGDEYYKLDSTEDTYKVSGQTEYLTSVDDCDFSTLKSELADYITATIASGKKHAAEGYTWTTIFDQGIKDFSGATTKASDVYFSTVKLNKSSDNVEFTNKLTFTYTVNYTADDEKGVFYACISAENIMKTADGEIKWGTKNVDDLDFVSESAEGSLENCVTTLIMCNTANYNISKVKV